MCEYRRVRTFFFCWSFLFLIQGFDKLKVCGQEYLTSQLIIFIARSKGYVKNEGCSRYRFIISGFIAVGNYKLARFKTSLWTCIVCALKARHSDAVRPQNLYNVKIVLPGVYETFNCWWQLNFSFVWVHRGIAALWHSFKWWLKPSRYFRRGIFEDSAVRAYGEQAKGIEKPE